MKRDEHLQWGSVCRCRRRSWPARRVVWAVGRGRRRSGSPCRSPPRGRTAPPGRARSARPCAFDPLGPLVFADGVPLLLSCALLLVDAPLPGAAAPAGLAGPPSQTHNAQLANSTSTSAQRPVLVHQTFEILQFINFFQRILSIKYDDIQRKYNKPYSDFSYNSVR